MGETIQANIHYTFGRIRAIVEMLDEPNREIYRMTPEKSVVLLREIVADYDAAQTNKVSL